MQGIDCVLNLGSTEHSSVFLRGLGNKGTEQRGGMGMKLGFSRTLNKYLVAAVDVGYENRKSRVKGKGYTAAVTYFNKLPYGKTHVAIASTHRFNSPATMAIELLEATSMSLGNLKAVQKISLVNQKDELKMSPGSQKDGIGINHLIYLITIFS
ncbi:hypothetical protein OUZ56_011531 [Daphnia magna]|uniref:Uncharacterized protein n=1 Tax=Daphnia magna TaxID=35525 RepID=A0ABQ9Z0R8_9CRUS|nr:hypothetical protein OUZ56_011531 [Daphnia magna]